MTLELSDLATIIGMTSAITTASTLVIVVRIKDQLKEDICNKIEGLLVRVGVLEKELDANLK